MHKLTLCGKCYNSRKIQGDKFVFVYQQTACIPSWSLLKSVETIYDEHSNLNLYWCEQKQSVKKRDVNLPFVPSS
jgi:hypothetical protein